MNTKHEHTHNRLPCGHRCPSFCSEPCPPPAYVACSPAAVREQQVDMLTLQSAAEVDLDADPLLFLRCGHAFCMSTLDGWLSLESAYERDSRDDWATLKVWADLGPFWELKPPSPPPSPHEPTPIN